MNTFSVIAALKGMKIWNENLVARNHYLVLVIPDYEKTLIEELIPALKEYLSFDYEDNKKILIVFTDREIQEILCECSIDLEFAQIGKEEMNCLVCYMLLTSKHYGTMRKQNVKLVSINNLYGNQLRLIADNKLYPLRSLISEEILNRI